MYHLIILFSTCKLNFTKLCIDKILKKNYNLIGYIVVKNIVKDEKKLMIKSVPATKLDYKDAIDLADTLSFNKKICVGMALNMIGISKAIIAFFDEFDKINIMYNPKIINGKDEYLAKEGCLSLSGVREAKRFKKIKVQFYNEKFELRIKTFTGFTAQIIQHEIDHINGIII